MNEEERMLYKLALEGQLQPQSTILLQKPQQQQKSFSGSKQASSSNKSQLRQQQMRRHYARATSQTTQELRKSEPHFIKENQVYVSQQNTHKSVY